LATLSAAKRSLYQNSFNSKTDCQLDSNYPSPLEHRLIESSVDGEPELNRRRCDKFTVSFSNPPNPLLASKKDEELFGNSSTEDDDILSTSNEEFDFHSIRKRFDR
jgi:hypothetical protein